MGYLEINREPQRVSAMIWSENTANGEELKGKRWEYTDSNAVWHSMVHSDRSFTNSPKSYSHESYKPLKLHLPVPGERQDALGYRKG